MTQLNLINNETCIFIGHLRKKGIIEIEEPKEGKVRAS